MKEEPATGHGTINRRFYGIFVRKECWRLSWRGRLVILTFVLLIAIVVFFNIYPFLAVTHRVSANVLVVEGWTHQFGVDAAVREFETGHYHRILTTGGPVEGAGPSSSVYDTDAWQSAELLEKAGISAGKVQAIPSRFVGRDRTYNSAIALREWFREHDPQIGGINVLTEGAHARRTWLLFQEALGPDVKVGIISVTNPDYSASRWWRYSEGVRGVISEGIAYVYAKLFFWPASK